MPIETFNIDRTLHLRLDHGEGNAFGPGLVEEYSAVMDEAQGGDYDCLVLRGREGMFSTGADLSFLVKATQEELTTFLRAYGKMLLDMWLLPLPTVSVVEGDAIGGGAILAMTCDTRIGVRTSGRVWLNETAVGEVSIPTWGLVIAQASIRPSRHTEAILQSRNYDIPQAHDAGFFTEVVEPGKLDTHLQKVCNALAALQSEPYAATKLRMRGRVYRRAMDILERDSLG